MLTQETALLVVGVLVESLRGQRAWEEKGEAKRRSSAFRDREERGKKGSRAFGRDWPVRYIQHTQ